VLDTANLHVRHLADFTVEALALDEKEAPRRRGPE
jgi:hypothetical protein